MSILIYAEHDGKELTAGTLSAVTCAQQIGGDIDLLVTGHNCGEAAQAASQVPGVGKVLVADGEHLGKHIAENVAPVIEGLAKNYDYVLAAGSTGAKNIIPRVAAKLDVQQISDISKVVSGDTFVRPIYAGNALATVQSSDSPKIITVRGTQFEAAAATGGSATVENIDAGSDQGLTKFLDEQLTQSEGPQLATARIVISGGRGVGSAENFKIVQELADQLGAAVGASRAAVDAGYVSNDYQVGQTGKAVAPDLYIAVGISGAIQHLAGMKDAKYIVAINSDGDAPIFEVADYGLEADLFEALPELKKKLAA